MQKTSCSTCHAKKQAVPHVMQKSKLFHMSCKNRAKPCKKASCSTCCKNHAKTMQNAARTERQPAEPSQSPASLLCVLYVLYLTRQATEHHSPRVPCYMCYMCYISLNIHSPRVPCYMCYCAIRPYIAHILQIFARTE